MAQTEGTNSGLTIVEGEQPPPEPPVIIRKNLVDVIHNESIYYTHSIITSWEEFMEIPYYRRIITINEEYKILSVELLIGMVGNSLPRRSRIQLHFDNEIIYDTVMSGNFNFAKATLIMKGYLENVKSGSHLIRVFARVAGGSLYIPKYNPDQFETFTPSSHAKLFILGFN